MFKHDEDDMLHLRDYFNSLNIDDAPSTIVIPAEWNKPVFTFGDEVYIVKNGHKEMVTGIKLEVITEYDVPPYSMWLYQAGCHWYRENQLSVHLSTADEVVARVYNAPTSPRQSEDW